MDEIPVKLKRKSGHKPTGFSRGRPRKGELRPPTPGGLWSAKWREENPELYLERNKQYVAKFRKENLERVLEIERNARIRAKLWKANQEINAIAEQAMHAIKEVINGS